jgi:hypothetical protein
MLSRPSYHADIAFFNLNFWTPLVTLLVCNALNKYGWIMMKIISRIIACGLFFALLLAGGCATLPENYDRPTPCASS